MLEIMFLEELIANLWPWVMMLLDCSWPKQAESKIIHQGSINLNSVSGAVSSSISYKPCLSNKSLETP